MSTQKESFSIIDKLKGTEQQKNIAIKAIREKDIVLLKYLDDSDYEFVITAAYYGGPERLQKIIEIAESLKKGFKYVSDRL